LGQGWLLLSAAIIVLAAILRQGSLLLVGILLLILYGAAQIWAKYALRRVEYTRRLSTTHAFFGDEVTFEISLANRKVLLSLGYRSRKSLTSSWYCPRQ